MDAPRRNMIKMKLGKLRNEYVGHDTGQLETVIDKIQEKTFIEYEHLNRVREKDGQNGNFSEYHYLEEINKVDQ